MSQEQRYKTVLVAIDRTDEADDVVLAAEKVAAQNDAQLHILTAVKPVTYSYAGYDAVVATDFVSLESDLVKAAEMNLQEQAAKIGLDRDRLTVKVGRPSSVIKDHARELGADLIVLGSHCRHGIGLLLGSTATGVLHGAPCDVLTLRIEE